MTEFPVSMEPDGWMEKTGGYAKDMTLRDYFAGEAMKAYLGRPNLPINVSDDELSHACYEMAKAMLKAKNEVA